MSRSRTLVFGCVLFILTFCYGSGSTIQAQTNQPVDPAHSNYDKTLQQLLAEVRELRLAVQRATFSHTRFQVALHEKSVCGVDSTASPPDVRRGFALPQQPQKNWATPLVPGSAP